MQAGTAENATWIPACCWADYLRIRLCKYMLYRVPLAAIQKQPTAVDPVLWRRLAVPRLVHHHTVKLNLVYGDLVLPGVVLLGTRHESLCRGMNCWSILDSCHASGLCQVSTTRQDAMKLAGT